MLNKTDKERGNISQDEAVGEHHVHDSHDRSTD